MEYFEIDNETEKKEKNKSSKNYKNKNILYLFLVFSFLFILFLNFKDSLLPEFHNLSKNNNEEENPKANDIYNIKSLELQPHLFTEYLMNLFVNYDKINLTIFENINMNIINQKIYSIISHENENKDLYIILSTIYGAFLADSMDSFCEFKSFNKNNHLNIFDKNKNYIFKPGQVTDDSEMAMSQAYAIMDNSDIYNLNQNLIFYYYLIWYKSHPLDIGVTTRNALSTVILNEKNNIKSNIFTDEIKEQIKEKNYNSLANGLLMRISPILCWFYMINKDYIRKILETKNSEKYYELYIKIFNQIEKDAQLTHPNRENSVSGAVFIFMGICAMEQKYSGKEIVNMVSILFNNNHFDIIKEEKIVKNHFINIINDIKKKDFEESKYFGNLSELMGYYLHAYKLTLYYLYKFDDLKKNLNIKKIYSKIIFDICDFGGDTDTNAAIVGMIIGPLIGIKNFGDEYLNTFLKFYDKKRLIYTNSFIYFYAKYLVEISSDNYKFGEKVNFNFYKMINELISKKL